MAQALAAVCSSAGKNIGASAKASILELVEEAFTDGRPGKSLPPLKRDADAVAENYNLAMGKVVSGLAKNDAVSVRSIVE